jgi:hypothetical protein
LGPPAPGMQKSPGFGLAPDPGGFLLSSLAPFEVSTTLRVGPVRPLCSGCGFPVRFQEIH